MAINIESADQYFDGVNHSLASVWFAFTEEQRMGAVSEARRQFERALRRTMNEDYSREYNERDQRKWLRDDYACFEQALHLLRRAPQSSPSALPPYPVAAEPDAAQTYAHAAEQWSPEALRWLGWTGASIIRS